MSGGHFQYDQYKIGYIADAISEIIKNNDSTEKDRWGDIIGYGFRPETIARFSEAVVALRRAQVMAHNIDWLVSNDTGEDTFLRTWESDLAKCEAGDGA